MAYKIEIKRSARKELEKLPKAAQRKVARAIDKLTDSGGEYRAKAGDYRIIYYILDDRVVVFVIAIQHRKEAYRRK